MSRKLSDVSLAYNKNVYHLDLARREFERQAISILEQVEAELIDVSRKHSDGLSATRWRNPYLECPQREIAWLNFRANTNITLDVKLRQFRNYKKDVAYLYFEIVFDEDLNEFVFQARLENQNAHPILIELDEKVIELARESSRASLLTKSDHIKTSTAIVFVKPISEGLLDDLKSLVKGSVEVIELALTDVTQSTADSLEPSASEDVAEELSVSAL